MEAQTPAAETIDLLGLLQRQRAAFMADPRPSVAERRARLSRLEAMLRANQATIAQAVSDDFGNRALPETILAEVAGILAASAHARRHLSRWTRPQRRSVAMTSRPARNTVEYTPIGVVGVVAPWNFPVYLTLGPLVDILAAGNRCILKPSELTPRTTGLLASLLTRTFQPEEVAVVQGDADVARRFCALPFNHLLFTGSTGVGQQVMRTAAEHLVPVTLELGGKSPVIVTPDYDVAKAANSIALGKFFNAGQVCVSPDYALVPKSAATGFARAVIAAAETMFPTLDDNPDYTTIISDRHYARLHDLVAEAESAGARVVRHRAQPGGNTRWFAPTVVLDPPADCRLMQEEIFGPILPVTSVDTVDDAIAHVNARPRPLALYIYTHDATAQRRILDKTLSGGVTVNGTILHVNQTDLPFGGIGPSGMGAYHGREGFLRFSHARAVHQVGFINGFDLLKPPYGRRVHLMLRALTGFTQPRQPR
ncbi:MAG TPA: coniferyl aldehyde dehydrogenase [Rhodopila sp.]|nr:coniferyl aldehyde dehydrogenase [Rhodopila sp.]